MNNIPENLIRKFISGQRLSNDEFILLEELLDNSHNHRKIDFWLEQNWQLSKHETVSTQFEQIREKIRISSLKLRMNQLFIGLSKIAALLFIPLLIAALYLYSHHTISSELLTLTTQKGEQTSVILPDGSKVWLNVDTKLSYPVNYGVNSRNLKLEGEAYFEVERNKELPFEVTSGNIITKALGTRFVISAYPESSEIKSSLVKGSVDIKCGTIHKILKPGQQLVFNKNKTAITVKPFEESFELGWKNNQLVFLGTPFEKVVQELEKWYDVKIKYNPTTFKTETLTVRFEKYETLERVLKVLAKVYGFEYTIKNKNIEIKK